MGNKDAEIQHFCECWILLVYLIISYFTFILIKMLFFALKL